MKPIFKNILTIGTVISAASPIAAVVSCSKPTNVNHYHILPTYTAQADQLIGLGVKPDYYPYQLDMDDIFGYLKNPAEYMGMQSEEFKNKFTNKINSLLPSKRGPSWWNQQALNDGERGSDPEYWQHISGDFVMYEHYLLDDGAKTINESIAPKHIKTPRNYLETNFRVSRDPFTRLPKNLMEALLDQDKYDDPNVATPLIKRIVGKMLDVARHIEGTDPSKKAVDGKPLPSGYPLRPAEDEKSWIYNDYVYAKNYHSQFLDNSDFQNSKSSRLILNSDGGNSDRVFDFNSQTNDLHLAKLFYEATFKPEESDIKSLAKSVYRVPTKRHHPVYEQQEEIGGAPMFEGAQRDNLLYFYNTAAKIQNAFIPPKANASQVDKESYQYLKDKIDSKRFSALANARVKADEIVDELLIRMSNIRKIVDKANNPTFGLFTLAPGFGQSTIQSNSKYSFIYKELGFKQPLPTNLSEIAKNSSANVTGAIENALFNMDDNGWWWNITDETGSVVQRSKLFERQFDLGVITANETQFNNLKDADKTAIASLFKGNISNQNLISKKVDYNLWNEGLKTPFVIHMVLDHIVKQLKNKYSSVASTAEWNAASNWGKFYSEEFIK